MKGMQALKIVLILLLSGLFLTGCEREGSEVSATAVPPTPTSRAAPTPAITQPIRNEDFLVVATDAPIPPYTDFNRFGEVIGFIPDIMDRLADEAGLTYEFVVTPQEGILGNIGQDYDVVMLPRPAPAEPPQGIAYTDPFLEVGQVMMTLLNSTDLNAASEIRPGTVVGVAANSSGQETAVAHLGINETDIFAYDTARQTIEALLDESVTAVVIDHHTAAEFTQTFPEQLTIIGGSGQEAWISSKAYSIAVPADNSAALDRLNEAIAQVAAGEAEQEAILAWLVPSTADIDAGESRVSTPDSEIIIGVIGQLADLEPANAPDLISWEVKNNVMGGLYRFNSDNELEPILAADFPTISEDKLEYTIPLRAGLQFPDGTTFTAEDVRWSISRASVAGTGSFLVNGYLKDSDDDNFADPDAVEVVDANTIRFRLQEPTAYFPALLATPPYFPVSDNCYEEFADPQSTCGGIGPYTVVNWEPGVRIRLQANPQWPGDPAPAYDNIQLRFYDDVAGLRRSLAEFQSIDMAWSGLPYDLYVDLLANDNETAAGDEKYTAWEGSATFKSYLIFDHAAAPWDSERVRQAAALAVDRQALAAIFNGSREPLFSPVPDDVPGHTPVFPERNLEQARVLLAAEGYSQAEPLPITIWYLNDGRYTPLEEAYANALKAQLEETGVFQVTLSGAPWEVFQTQIFNCGYPAYLLGWPSPGKPVDYLDPTSWTDFFVENTDRFFCSNYQSEEMDELRAAADEELDPAARAELYAQIQALWAEELPTLDLTQEPRFALSLTKMGNVEIDALGLLHYEALTKEPEPDS